MIIQTISYKTLFCITFARLPKDELCLAIVESKPVGQVLGVSDKDDFFVHTPRKTIAELSESRQVKTYIYFVVFLFSFVLNKMVFLLYYWMFVMIGGEVYCHVHNCSY